MITRAYRIITILREKAILCLLCDRLSYNPNDIQHHYCGHCKVVLDQVPEDYRRPASSAVYREPGPSPFGPCSRASPLCPHLLTYNITIRSRASLRLPLVAARRLATSAETRCLRSLLIVSNVGGLKNPAKPATARGQFFNMRRFEANCPEFHARD